MKNLCATIIIVIGFLLIAWSFNIRLNKLETWLENLTNTCASMQYDTEQLRMDIKWIEEQGAL